MIDLEGGFFFSFSFLFNTAAHSLDVWHSVVLDRVVFFFHLLSWVYSTFMRWIKGLKGVRGNIRYRWDCPFACLINPELLYVCTSTVYRVLVLVLVLNNKLRIYKSL